MLGTVLAFLLTLSAWMWWNSSLKNAFPSPGLALPVVGHLYLVKGDFLEQLHTWRRRLGDVFTMQLGPFRYVVLNGYNAISTVYLNEHKKMLGRPNNFPFGELFQHTGIIALAGHGWQEQRTFLQTALRSLGMGRNVMAERIRVETDYLLVKINNAQGKAIDVSNLILTCVTNVVCSVCFSKRFTEEDEHFVSYQRDTRRGFELLGSSAIVNFFPFVKYLPGDPFHYRELKTIFNRMKSTILYWAEKDKRNINLCDQAYDDMTQSYLIEIERKRREGVTDTSLDDTNFVTSLVSLFSGGTETTTNTVIFALLYMINFPELQARLYQEIKEHVGVDWAPTVSDKKKLKFLLAFIMETQRFAGIVPVGLDRLATTDIYLQDYTIKKGTCIMANFDSVLRDGFVWGDPDVFRPDRFLEENDLVFKKQFIPFGIGKRNCLGEGLAHMELFIFISALVQKFEFFPEVKGQPPTMEPEVGFSRVAKPFKIKAVPRVSQ